LQELSQKMEAAADKYLKGKVKPPVEEEKTLA